MKVWVCRDLRAGNYALFEEQCDPALDEGTWACECKDSHVVGVIRSDSAKRLMQLRRHIQKGKRQLLEVSL